MRPKLTPEQAAEVVTRYRAGETTVSIAKDYGIIPQSVCNYVLRAGFPLKNMSEDEALVKATQLLDDGLTHQDVRGALHISGERMSKAVALRKERDRLIVKRASDLLRAGVPWEDVRRETGASAQLMSRARATMDLCSPWLCGPKKRGPKPKLKPASTAVGRLDPKPAKRWFLVSLLAKHSFSVLKTANAIGVSKQAVYEAVARLGLPSPSTEDFRQFARSVARELEDSATSIRQGLEALVEASDHDKG